MFLSLKSLQVLTFLGVFCFSYLLASVNNEKERSVAEAQLMHDKGKTIEEITRQRWLQGLLAVIHNPGRREVSLLRNLHREVNGAGYEERQKLNINKNNQNLQYRNLNTAHSKKMSE
ncbi:unnamed protein product [Staurois parvus]|uniref:Parathyroid hormone n=1 Tax=Staurois parvus TaxID=386267 RepID=A0ABN9E0J6_9NEOB|nr:unnamed protein product [Staurois parvus]